MRILVTGAGGFIGSHLVKRLVRNGNYVLGVDVKKPEFEPTAASAFELRDLRDPRECDIATRNIAHVYNLAADMGGIGYIAINKANVVTNNSLININMLDASRRNGVSRFFFPSSACVYPQSRQSHSIPLKEDDVRPYDPLPGYGWEKLYTEQLCEYYCKDYGLQTRVARFQTIFGDKETYDGGREKVPAAICRKVAMAEDGGEIEIWGDGEQSRSFLYVDDCINGVLTLMQSSVIIPVNIGSERLVTINEMTDMIIAVSGKKLTKRYNVSYPQGVRGRCSDNTFITSELGWQPMISLEEGLKRTYQWIEKQVAMRAVRQVPITYKPL